MFLAMIEVATGARREMSIERFLLEMNPGPWNRDLSTARIADALAFNADYLGRAFRDAFGETLTDHIHRLRIDLARMLFRSTDRSVERVVAEVGFGDERYFRRVFKRRVGLTPDSPSAFARPRKNPAGR